jgi:hypothetical protein
MLRLVVGLTIRIDSDEPLTETLWLAELRLVCVGHRGGETLRFHFANPGLVEPCRRSTGSPVLTLPEVSFG